MSMGTFGILYVYCDMTTDDGGWIVIQRNQKDEHVSFNRNWREYEEGFGRVDMFFWFGLKLIHLLTYSGQWEMRVNIYKSSGGRTYTHHIHYNQFKVESPTENYKLTVGGYTGEKG